MTDFMPLLVIAAALAGVLGLLARLAVVVRRRGSAGAGIAAALAAHDEAFRVTAHESYVEIQARTERKAPLLSPDGLWTRRTPLPPRRRPSLLARAVRRTGLGTGLAGRAARGAGRGGRKPRGA
ncbi:MULTISPECIES: hypothetical protein [unclassified Streptomyces]|uniref:hypothetical protein n=1 Tax=unclassified Streptomyces TaxID=2593676 RepID=UPI002E31745A|nr:hypothetical protein [Streptomyces sp. NBC_01268]